MRKIWNELHALKPAMLMVAVQIAYAGVNILYKMASNDGMTLKIVVAYRYLFASAFIVPLAFFLERKSRPKLAWKILCQAFLCGLFGGSLLQNLFLESLALTSATFATAMGNLVPVITFILAVTFRLEKLNIREISGRAKVLGTLMGIGGAMLLTFYKGVELHIWSTHVDLLRYSHDSLRHVSTHSNHRLLGSLLSLVGCFSYASWLIIQTKMSEGYPCHYSSSALTNMMAAIQAVGYALCVERDWSRWKLGWNIRLLTVSYTGIVASGATTALIAWCVRMRGPMFVSVFLPLALVLVALAGSLFLEEELHLGSVLGAVLIVCGLYLVLWGKGKEMKKTTQLAPSDDRDHQSVTRESELKDIVILTSSPMNNNVDVTTSDGINGSNKK